MSNVSASKQGQDWSTCVVCTQLDNTKNLFAKHPSRLLAFSPLSATQPQSVSVMSSVW